MRPDKTMLLVIGLGVVGVMTLFTWAVEENEEKVSIDQLPAAVKATILMEAKGGTIKEIERELEDGKIVYEAEVVIDGKEVEVLVTPTGEVYEDDED